MGVYTFGGCKIIQIVTGEYMGGENCLISNPGF